MKPHSQIFQSFNKPTDTVIKFFLSRHDIYIGTTTNSRHNETTCIDAREMNRAQRNVLLLIK